uniref:Uncharacterized protein LOC111111646 isoform X11 n=1 Tax=Crassostrea virginica TaxID=6565 RepID=A0A8B8BM94_CRAVI|nr:uncharacterized protein LOC111111646 isoform X11 [Crassostrea virginica]
MAGICWLELLAASILLTTVLSCPNNCFDRGTCDTSVTPSRCRCNPPYIGEACQVETFEVTRQGPFSPLISAQNIPYLPFSLKSCSKVYLELRRVDAGGYGFELGSPDLPYSSLDRVPTQETGQLDYKMGDVLDCKKFLEFWLDWDNGLLRLGKGSVRGENVFLSSQEDPGLRIDQIILNGGTWRLPVQYRAPFQEQGAQLLEFNGPDVQGNTVMMGQQGSPMVIGGMNPPQSGQFVQGQFGQAGSMLSANQMGTQMLPGTNRMRHSPIEEVQLNSGRYLEIECGIKSPDPNMEIKWTKNGVPWTPPPNNPKIYFADNKRKIVFESIKEEDNGNYMCVANNLYKSSATTDLFLQSPDSAVIVHEPKKLYPTLGGRLELLCDIHSTDPNLQISWLKDGQPFNPTDPTRVSYFFNNKILVFNSVQTTDDGKYTCRSSDGYINPTSLLVFTQQPDSQKFSNIFETSTAQGAGVIHNTGSLQNLPVGSGYFEITCNANPSDLTSAVRWTKNGQPFRFNPDNPYVYFTNDNRKIIFESLTPNDNGIYTCYMNDTAHSSSSTDLFIENANDAMVAFMPERKNPVVGGVLELRCDVTSSDQNIKLSWTKDQTPLLPSPRVVMQNKNQLVTIYNITSADSGQYQCIANGDLSTAVSTFVNVHSKELLAEGTTQDTRFAEMFRQPVGGQFFMDGNRMSGNQMIQGQMVGGQMVGGQMIGGQMVGGQMTGGQMVGGQMVGTQSVAGLRTIKKSPMERKTISQGYFEIQCNVPESSRGEITWLKDGQVFLIPSNRPVYFRNGKRTIVFESVAPEDNGLYTCIINNQYQTSASTDLYIMDRDYYNADWAKNAMVVHEPQTLNPVLGTRLELSCDITTTNPNIRLTWLKNGVPIKPEANGRIQFQNYNQLLLFDPVEIGDSGKYTCQANDPMRTSVSTLVKVHEREEYRATYSTVSLSGGAAPQKTNPLQEVNIKSGYFEINCLIDSGNSEISWAKNGLPFTPPANRAVYFANNKRKIVFEKLQQEDSGLYTCVANNEYLTSASTDLFIEGNMERAIVVYVPRRLNPIIGSRLEITCDVHDDRSQNPNTKVTWFKESMPIAFENNPNLSIQDNGRKILFRSISAMDQGHFMCAVDDPNVAPVVMYIQPHASEEARGLHFGKFLGQIAVASSKIPIEGGNLRIQCDVADGATSIAWFKDNRPLDENTPGVAFEDDYKRLVLFEFGPNNNGVYMCVAGGLTWRSAAKELSYISPVEAGVTSKPLKMYPLFQSAVEIRCGVPGLQPQDTVNWEFDGRPLPIEPGRVELMDGGQVVWINPFLESDIGRYSCNANGYQWSIYLNGYYSAGERSAALGNPVFMESLYWMYGPRRQINYGAPMTYPLMSGRAEIMCGIQTTNPNILFRWLKDGRPLQRMKPTYYMYNGRILVMMGFSPEDNGKYTCVTNDGSMSSASTRLSYTSPDAAEAVYEPPKMNPLIGGMAEVICNIPDLPADVPVQWKKDGRPFNPVNIRVKFSNNNRKIEFRPVYASDTGSYECIANNDVSSTYTTNVQVFNDDKLRQTDVYGNPTFLLSQNNRPLPSLQIGRPQNIPIQNGAVELLCGAQTTNPNAVFTWLKDGFPLKRTPVYYKNDGRVLIIPNFTPEDNGRYTCVTNDNSLRSSSTKLNFVSPDVASATYDLPKMSPLSGRRAVLSCNIPDLPQDVSVSWMKNGIPFSPAPGRIYFQNNNRQIVFTTVYPEDAGSYKCMAADGSTLSYTTGVNVFNEDNDRTNAVYGPAITNVPVSLPVPMPAGPVDTMPDGQPQDNSPPGQPQGIYPDSQPSQILPDGQPRDILPPEQPQGIYPDGQPRDILPPGQPQGIYPDGQPRDILPPEQPQGIYPDGQPRDILPPGQPQGIYPDGQPRDILPPEQPQGIYPDGQPRDILPPGQPQGIYPDGQPRDILPPEQPQGIYPDGQPQDILPPGQPQGIYPDGQQPQILPDGQPQDILPSGQPQQILPSPDDIIQQGQPLSYPVNAGAMYLRCGIQTTNPNTIIRWLKDGRPLRRMKPTYYMYNGRILVLMGFTPEDNGRYTCVANDRTMSSSSTKLQFDNPTLATATYEPPKMNPLTGEKAELVCNLPNVDPGLQVFWSKDGMSFEPNSPRVQFAANGMKIEFSSVIPEDAGSYTCSVNDEVGTSYTTNVIVFPDNTLRETDVYGSPTFLLSQNNKPQESLPIGERLNLPVDSGTVETLCGIQTSNPDAVFTWLKDGKPVTRTPVFYKDNGRVLVLPDFTPADNGKYTCITNDKSMSSSSTDLTYVDPGRAVAVYNPPSKNPLTDDKAELFCNIPNLRPLDTVMWFKDGAPFNPQDQRIQMVNGNKKIEFSPVFPEDAGAYTCQTSDGKTYSIQLNPYPTDSERKVTVYGPERINEIPEPLPDEFLRPTPPTDRVPPMDPTSDPNVNPEGMYPDGLPPQPEGIYPDRPRPPTDVYPDGTPRQPDQTLPGRLPPVPVNPDELPQQPDGIYPDRPRPPTDVYPDGTPRQPDQTLPGRLPPVPVNPDELPLQPDGIYPDRPRPPTDVYPDGTPRQPDQTLPGRLPPVPVNPDELPPQPDGIYPDRPRPPTDVYPDGTPRQPDQTLPGRLPPVPVNPDELPPQPEGIFPDRPQPPTDVYPDGMPMQPGATMPSGLPPVPLNPDGTPRIPDPLQPGRLPIPSDVNPDGSPRKPDGIYPDRPQQPTDVYPDGTPMQPDGTLPLRPPQPSVNPDGSPRMPDGRRPPLPPTDIDPNRLPSGTNAIYPPTSVPDVSPDSPRQPNEIYPDKPSILFPDDSVRNFDAVSPKDVLSSRSPDSNNLLTPGFTRNNPPIPGMPPPVPPSMGGKRPSTIDKEPSPRLDTLSPERSPVTITAKEGKPLSLDCGTPWRRGDEISWYKDGEPLDTSLPNAPVMIENQLVFPQIMPYHRGQYTCTVNNNLATATNTILTTIPADPNLLGNQDPELLETTEDDIYTLVCKIPNIRPGDRISWYKNNAPMRETPRITITGDAIEFRPVRLSDEGSYNCMKNDDIASTYSSELTVLPREGVDQKPNAFEFTPVRPSIPSNIDINQPNQPVAPTPVDDFEAVRRLPPPPPIFGLIPRPGPKPMPTNPSSVPRVPGNLPPTGSVPRVPGIRPPIDPTPRVPNDPFPRIPTDPISRVPDIRPSTDPILPVDPRDVEIAPGHFRPVERTRFNLECAISKTTGKVVWMKDGRSIGNELPQDPNGNLLFGSVRLTDSGRYTCISDDHRQTYNAAVDVLPDDINTFLLSEKGKDPELRMPNMNYYRPEAETPFTINCVIPGADYRNPVVWMKDGEPLDLSKPSFMRVVEGGQSLVFDSIRLAQSGIYTCRVGPEGQSAIVDVRPQSVQEYLLLSYLDDESPKAILPSMGPLPGLKLPETENSPKVMVVNRGEPAFIPCDSGYNVDPNAPVYWYRDKNMMVQSRGVSLQNNAMELASAELGDAGLYTCVLGDGEATSSTRLFVNDPASPIVPTDPVRPVDPRSPSVRPDVITDPRRPPFTEDRPPIPTDQLPSRIPNRPLPPPIPPTDSGFKMPPIPLPPRGLGDPEPTMPRDIPREPTLPVEPATPVEIAPGHFRPVERTDFILVCKIPGNGGNVYWMKDGKQIPMNLVDIDGNLPFSSIQLPDSGLYTCISGDRRRSYNAAVDVVPDNINDFVLSERNRNPADRRANMEYFRPTANTNFLLRCDIPGADYRQNIIWAKDGRPLDLSKPNDIGVSDEGRTLIFPSILRRQAGVYTCQVGNDDKVSIVDVRPDTVQEYLLLSDTDDNSPMAILPNMDQMPALKLPEENTPKLLVVPEFSDAPIQCDVAMNARPDVPVYWFRNGEQIPNPQSRDARNNGLLYLPNIRMSDAGLYTCVLGDGEATSSTRVIVTEPTRGPDAQVDPTDRLPPPINGPIDPRDRLPSPIDGPIDPRNRLPPPIDGPIDPRNRLPPPIDGPFDPRDRLPPPIDGPVDPRDRLPPRLPPIPTDRDRRPPYIENPDASISPYPKGTEQPFIDPQDGIYTLPNLEIPGQFNNQLLGEGPEQPSRPDAQTILSDINPRDRPDLRPVDGQLPPSTDLRPPVQIDPLGPTDPRRIPTRVPPTPGSGGRFVIPSLGGIIEQFYYPRISQDFRLTCNLKGITANTPVAWYKGDREFQPEPGRVRIVNNAIEFTPAIREDSGSYSCMRLDTMESIRAQLYVNGDTKPPGIREERLPIQTQPEGSGNLVQHFYYPSSSELFELRCDLKSGDNRVPIRWLMNGRPFIIPVDRPVTLHENNHVIRFSSISPRDNGRYTCIAGDNLASVSSEIVVTRPDMQFTPGENRISLSSNDRDALLQFTGTQGFSNKYFPIVRRPFILNCTAAQKNPSMPIRWLKNGSPYRPDGARVIPRGQSLAFSSIMPDDSGHYTCIVGDNQDAENIIVDVIFHDMGPDENAPGRPILRRRYLLTCGISSIRPNTQITWFKDGRPFMANSDRVRFVDNKRGILFTSIMEQDNGEYMCIANYGTSRASYTTTINAAQEKLHEIITVPLAPTEHRAPLAEMYALVCALSSVSEAFPPIWFKDGRPFTSRNAPPNVSFRDTAIIFNPVTKADEGRYTCTSQDGSDQYTSDLLPVPKLYTPTEGQPLSVACQLPGDGPVQWLKDGIPFPQGNSRTISLSNNGRLLTFTPVSPKNDGEYTCMDPRGGRFTLGIKVIPTMLFPQSKSIFVLRCALPNMSPRRMIVWMKDGQVFRPNQERISFNVGNGVREVIFNPLLPEDSGRYTCVDPDNQQYMVNVIVDGRTAARRNFQPTVTQAFRIECDIPGIDPTSTVYWLKGQEIFVPPREDIKFEDGNKVIVFESVMPEDYGTYTCVTPDGSEFYTINVDVQSGPGHKHVTVGVTERQVTRRPANSAFMMRCMIPGLAPDERVVWLKEQQVFDPIADRVRFGPLGRTIAFLPLRPEDAGYYTCVSELTGTTLSQVLEVGPPLYPEDYRMEVSPDYYRPVETKPFSLYCKLPGYPGRVFWMKDGRLFDPKQIPSITLSDGARMIDFDSIRAEDSGFYMCVTQDFSAFYPAAVDVLPFPIYQYMSSVGPPDRQMRPGDALPGNLDYVRVPAGTKFEVICKIPDPRTPVAWTKDGQPLNSPVPRFPSIAKSDSGVYTCRSGDQEYTVLVDVVPRNVQEYLLLSDRPDEKPSLRLPDRMPDKPRLTLPGSPDEKLRYAAPGEPFALICDVPPGSKPVRWFKDGRSYSAPRPGVLVDNMEGLIRFNQLMMEDSGVYTCVAENGDHFYSTRLDVNPNHTKVTINLAETITSEADALSKFQLVCNIPMLNAEDEVAWLKDNQMFLPDVGRDITFSSKGRTITFGRIRESDSGIYTCVSQRLGSQVSQRVIVNQPIYPDYYKVEVSPGYYRPVETKPFTLRCPGTGPPVIWIKNGMPLDDGQGRIVFSNGNRQARFRSITRMDSGNYACITQDDRILHLSAVDVVPLDVYNYIMALGPPDRQTNQLLNIPSNLGYFRPRSGDMFELFCNLSESALRQPIMWTKDGTELPQARNQRVLLFPAVYEEDGGYYICQAGNSQYNALVDVKPRSVQEYLLLSETADEKPSLLLPNALDNRPRLDLPLDVREEAKIQTRPPGVGYVLVCDLPPSVPYNAPIKWYKNGVAYDVPNSGRVSLLDNGRVLQFQTLKREDGGLYSCVAGNNLALYASRIVIAPGPANVAGTEQVPAPAANRQHNIRINQQFTLICEIPQTVPEIPIIWLKNGRPFIPQDPNRVLVTQRRISFSPVQVSDTGRYTCMAVDNSASFTAAVNVMAAGARTGDTQLLNIWQQQFRPTVLGAFELTCSLPAIVSDSTPVIWMKNGRRMPIDNTGRITYSQGNRKIRFSEILPEDKGWYTCVALDNSASYTLSLSVDLDGTRETDSVGTALRISHGQLGMLYELRCLLPDVGKPITWFKNGQPLRPDPSNRITFRNRDWVVLFNPLQPVDAGYYMCRYRDNSMSYSTAIRVAGAPQSDFRSIRNFYLMQPGGKFELRCGIQSQDPNFQVIWLKDGRRFNPSPSRRISFANGNSRIIFNSLNPDDAGFYTCISGGYRYFTRLYMKSQAPPIDGPGCMSQCGTTASSCSIQLNCTNYLICQINGKECNCDPMMCSFGTFWNPALGRCASTKSTSCDSDPCLMLPARSTYPSDFNCRSFYRCSGAGKSVPMCCNANFRYDHRTMSCQPDSRCTIGCLERQIMVAEPAVRLMTPLQPQPGVCFLVPVSGRPDLYFNRASGSQQQCPGGTVFNAESCVCENSLTLTHIHEKTTALVKECEMLLQMVFGPNGIIRNEPNGVYTEVIDVETQRPDFATNYVGIFNGKTSQISTPRFINDEIEAIYVTFNFLERNNGNDFQVLFSNCGALTTPYTVPGVPGRRTSSVEILLDRRRQEIIFIGKTDDPLLNSVVSRVPYTRKGDQWNKVELAFDGYKLRGVVTSDVNGTPVKQMTMEPLMGRLIPAPTITSLGRCSDSDAFKGYMDKIKVSNCIPLG